MPAKSKVPEVELPTKALRDGSHDAPGTVANTGSDAVAELDKPNDIPPTSMKGGIPPGYYSRICRVIGRIVGARGLPKTDRMSASDPYCVVKGIQSNSNLTNIHITKTIWNSLLPTWDEEFDFEVPREWGLEELAGLRCLVYDSDSPYRSFTGEDDFLGGADIDISTQCSARTITHELDMGGVKRSLAKGKRKGRMTLVVTVFREVIPFPLKPPENLQNTMQHFTYIREVVGSVCHASGLPNMDAMGLSDPVCLVRVVLASGEVREIYRTKVIYDELEPEWNEDFRARFGPLDQPLLIMFDIYDEDDPDEPIEEDGDHLGTAIVPLFSALPPAPRTRNLWLQGETQRHEMRHNQYGMTGKEAKRKGGPGQGLQRKLQKRKQLLKAAALTDSPQRGREAGTGLALQQNLLALVEAGAEHVVDEESMFQQIMANARANMEARGQAPPKKGFRSHVTSAYHAIMGTYSEFKPNDRSILTVQLRTRVKTEPMPFKDWYIKPFDVADEEDVEAAAGHPDWERTAYCMPDELQMIGKVPARGEMIGQDHASFIYGVVNGASALPLADGVNKNDVYCLIHGLGQAGEKYFIHRTRVIKDTISPNWSEAFYWAVEPEDKIVRVVLSIFALPVTAMRKIGASLMDSIASIGRSEEEAMQESQEVAEKTETLLGRANLDLSYICSGEVSEQEVQLQGGNYKVPQEKVTTGLRRPATLHFEVIIDRKVRPIYSTARASELKSIPRRVHSVTRQPEPDRAFIDTSQFDPPHTITEMAVLDGTCKDVRELLQTRRMLSDGAEQVAEMGERDWTDPSIDDALHKRKVGAEEAAEEHEEQLKPKLPKMTRRERRNQVLPPAADFTLREPLRRAKSLPALKTKFGQTPNHLFFPKTLEEVPKVRIASFNNHLTVPAVRNIEMKPKVDEVLRPRPPNGATVYKPVKTEPDRWLPSL